MPRPPRDAKQDGERQYEHQIPSRDEILKAMEDAGQPLLLEALAPRFGIKTEQHRRALEARLRAMVRDGQLLRNRADEFCLTRHLNVIAGRVIAHRDGFGFLKPDDGSDDLYLSAREMQLLWEGDRVAVRASETPRGREGNVVEILARGKTRIAGPFRRERGIDFVRDTADSRVEVLIPRGQSHGAKGGDIVSVEVLEYPTKNSHAIGRVVEVVGGTNDAGIETELAMLAHGIPREWPEDALVEARSWSTEVPAKAKEGREDLRNVPLVTIDGADARDFDDAVFCERQGDSWRLIVAIADVSYYVRADSPLDREARGRGTSVYFPDRVVPMLPEALSNGLCSLNPDVDRLCHVCDMHVSADGEVTRSRFYEAVMRSHARLTYNEAAEILVAARPRGLQAELRPHLKALEAVYEAFAKVRKQRGAIDFDLPETKIQLDEHGKVASVKAVERLVTHKIIEECMIAANVESAKRIHKGKIPGLYRVHAGPEADRLEELMLFLRTFGYKLTPKNLTPKDLNRIIEAVAGKPEEELVEMVVLRSMKQARYQPGNVGHFGLALGAYAHFTSPIRRYPDLLVHRAIKWLSEHRSAKGYRYGLEEMERLGEHCSMTERRADLATREVVDKLKCIYLKDHIGETFDAVIASVVPFGLFVRLPGIQADGLVHVTALPRDYYHRDAGGTTLSGERTGSVYRLTAAMKVRLVAVNVEERKIDLVPAETEQAQAPARGPRPPGERKAGNRNRNRSRGR